MNLFVYVAVVAVGIFLVAEILVAYQKYQMRKQFIEELDKGGKDRTSS
jgi:hypothetical protein